MPDLVAFVESVPLPVYIGLFGLGIGAAVWATQQPRRTSLEEALADRSKWIRVGDVTHEHDWSQQWPDQWRCECGAKVGVG